MSKAFLRYSFSIVRAASMQRRRCRNARCDARALFTTFALGRAPSAFGTFANNCRLRLARGLRDRAVALARLHPPSRPWESSLATPERGHGDVSLLLLDAGVADHPGPTLRLFLLELR